jgi:hypothetical protein
MAGFKTELVKAAKAELERFGGRDETHEDVHDILIAYWTDGAGRTLEKARREVSRRTAWSAAFISFAVKAALDASRSRAAFAFSGAHSEYVGAAIRNLLNGVGAPVFLGHPPDNDGAVAPGVGDIVGGTRTLAIDDYADALLAARDRAFYSSHFDIVVAKANGVLTLIGGNVGNTVKQTRVRLTAHGLLPKRDFKFDSAGKVLSGPFICVVQHTER